MRNLIIHLLSLSKDWYVSSPRWVLELFKFHLFKLIILDRIMSTKPRSLKFFRYSGQLQSENYLNFVFGLAQGPYIVKKSRFPDNYNLDSGFQYYYTCR